MKTFLLICSLFGACGTVTAQDKVNIQSGFYHVSDKTDSSVMLKDYSDTLYLYPTPFIKVSDFLEAKLMKDYADRWNVEIIMTPAGKVALRSASEAWQGNKMAVIVKNKIVMAPILNTTIREGKFVINGLSGKGEANKLLGDIQSEM